MQRIQTDSELHDRLNQCLQKLSPPLLQLVLDFVEFLLAQPDRFQGLLQNGTPGLTQEPEQLTPQMNGRNLEQDNQEHPLLEFVGAWQGDDGPQCLETVYSTRSRSCLVVTDGTVEDR
ncbi:MAG: hypothetical protein ACO331_15000 [Prochlorothrix sp.]